MELNALLESKEVKALEKRRLLVQALRAGELSLAEMEAAPAGKGEKNTALLLEAAEELSREEPGWAEEGHVRFAAQRLASPSNSVKREAARVVGNLAGRFPRQAEAALPALLENARHEGTVVRWSSAYALGRMVALPEFATGPLYATVSDLAGQEDENGVKKQYLGGLKKAEKLRRKAGL